MQNTLPALPTNHSGIWQGQDPERWVSQYPIIQGDVNLDTQFSLASRSLASVADSVIAKWETRPEWKDAVIKRTRESLGKMRRDGDWKVSFGKAWQRIGDDNRMAGNRTVDSIEAEVPMRQALRADELEKAGIDGLEPWVMLAYEQGLTKLRDHPVVAAMLEKGKLMSRGEARKAGKITVDGKETGDYDGAPRLPPAWYAGKGAGYMPDVMAQELYNEGVLNDSTPDALWDALRSAMDQHAKDNEQFKKARAAVDGVMKQARNQAREELYEWAREQKEKIPTAHDRQMMGLRTLDALLAVLRC